MKTALAIALLCISTLALAEKPAAVKGFYVEGTAGRTSFVFDSTANTTVDKTDSNYGGMVGYDFNDNFALEGGYRDIGEGSISATGAFSGTVYGKPLTFTGTVTASGEARGWLFGPRVNLRFNDKVSGFVRGGLFRWDADTKVAASAAYVYDGVAYAGSSTQSKSFSRSDTYWGLGINFDLSPQSSIGLGYSEFKFGGDLGATLKKAQSVDLNLKYRFE